MKRTTHSYFVVMMDYGRKGLEAIVDPEITRREVVSRVISAEYRDIVFIHEIRDGTVTDITDDIKAEAEAVEDAMAAPMVALAERILMGSGSCSTD